MKFLPKDKKKKYWSIGILTVSVLGIVYINFFMNAPSVFLDVEQSEPPVLDSSDSQPETSEDSSSKLPELRPPGSGPLPYGPDIAEGMLEDDRFETLRQAPEFEVTKEELGKDNLFNF